MTNNTQRQSKGIIFFIIMGLFSVLSSCHQDDDPELKELNFKWHYKVEASPGSVITNIIYQNPHLNGVEPISVTGINSTSWTSSEFEYKTIAPAPGNVSLPTKIKAKAIGLNDTSTLNVEIYVNGVLVKKSIDVGQILTASAEY